MKALMGFWLCVLKDCYPGNSVYSVGFLHADFGVSVGSDEQERWPPDLHHHHSLHRAVLQRYSPAQLCTESGMNNTGQRTKNCQFFQLI